ncbi:DsbA family protein [Mycobacterium sp.]|jgi:protein-disulfide isomerase|uniref:DsbA family protein n=1 Tax=Mycobacterium sp. TaxID=1785 RepID=UPI002D3F12B9|nr:thioredoxin domain-containing protein [Mycobacterium sp.]HZA09497.1 thioredoxin domain-containing protein [Mycobacterium sp.]
MNVAAAVWIMVAAAACTSTTDGRAVAPSGVDLKADVVIAEDGYGVQLGKPYAPAAIEIFTEPLCSHCADLQFYFGEEMQMYVERGDLVVTYRPLTFLDPSPRGYSHQVANAWFLAAAPGTKTKASAMLGWIQDLYWQMNPNGPNIDAKAIAKIAKDDALPSEVADRIAAGDRGVDLDAMAKANTKRLEGIINRSARTPTVYDVNAKQVIDVGNDNWVKNLVQGG